jgi:hypothetical protein
LRKQYPKRAVAVLNLVNGCAGYLPPRGLFAMKTYQVNVSLFAEGCLEQTLRQCSHLAQDLEKSSES